MIGFLQLLAMLAFFIAGATVMALRKNVAGEKVGEMYAVGLLFIALGVGIVYWRKWKVNFWFFVALTLASGILVGLLF